MVREVSFASFQSAALAPGILHADQTLCIEKQAGVKMYTGEEPGFLTVYRDKKYVGIPIANIKSLVWKTALPQEKKNG